MWNDRQRDGRQETVLHNFTGQLGLDGSRPQAGLVVLGSNALSGTTFGANPLAGLTAYNGALFGTTSAGGVQGCDAGDSGCGTLFTVTSAGVERVLHAFQTNTEGEAPVAALMLGQKNLYGTASEGGTGARLAFRAAARSFGFCLRQPDSEEKRTPTGDM